MSILDLSRKHPRLYKEIFTRGIEAERVLALRERVPKRDPDARLPIAWGKKEHSSLIMKEIDLAFSVL
jgi:hypothetical protein